MLNSTESPRKTTRGSTKHINKYGVELYLWGASWTDGGNPWLPKSGPVCISTALLSCGSHTGRRQSEPKQGIGTCCAYPPLHIYKLRRQPPPITPVWGREKRQFLNVWGMGKNFKVKWNNINRGGVHKVYIGSQWFPTALSHHWLSDVSIGVARDQNLSVQWLSYDSYPKHPRGHLPVQGDPVHHQV